MLGFAFYVALPLFKEFLDSSGDEGSRDFCKSETNEKLKIW